MGLVTEGMGGLAVNNAAKTKEVDQEKLRLKKEQRKQRREEERRQLGEERVEDFNVDVPLPPLLIVMRRANAPPQHAHAHTHTLTHTHTRTHAQVMAEYVLGSKYRAQRRTVTESVKANAELFPYNFELSKEDQRERVLQQVRNLTTHAHITAHACVRSYHVATQVRWIAAKGWASLDMLKYVFGPSARFGLVVVVVVLEGGGSCCVCVCVWCVCGVCGAASQGGPHHVLQFAGAVYRLRRLHRHQGRRALPGMHHRTRTTAHAKHSSPLAGL
jgi:hypothetical protein